MKELTDNDREAKEDSETFFVIVNGEILFSCFSTMKKVEAHAQARSKNEHDRIQIAKLVVQLDRVNEFKKTYF